MVFGLIFSIILERFWIDFDLFREFAKTRKSAPRSSESTKIKGLGSRTWHQNQKKTHRNLLQNLKRKIISKLSQNGSNIEAKWSPKGITISMFFWFGFGMALETLMGLRGWLRRVREWGTFSSGSPRAALVRAGLSNKNRQRRSVGKGSDTPRAVGSAIFSSFWRCFVTKSVKFGRTEVSIAPIDAKFQDLSFGKGPGPWFFVKYMIFVKKNINCWHSLGG